MLSGFASSLLQRVTGTDDPAVLKASWEDPSILQVLGEPSLVRAVEEIHENRDKLGKYKEVNEVVLAVRKVDSLTGLTGEEVPSLPEVPAQITPGYFDVEDWDQLRWYEKDWRIGRRLQEKGFCILKGSLSSDERQRAVAQADELRRAGGFERLPREVISGYFGEGSAWTRNLSPDDPQEEALRLVESRLLALGSDLAHCSVAFSGFRLQGHMPGMVHCSRGVEDQPNPGLADPDVANYYLGIFMRKKLKLFYFLGPNPALLSVCPATAQDESQVFRTVLQPGAMVVIRAEACSCGLFPSPSEPCTVVEVDFLAEQKHSKESAGDRMVPPQELQEWLLDRLKAIVDNDVQADVPEEWIKLARQTFVRSRPAKILEVSHRLPGQHCVWEEVALGGYDCITEIPPSKWEVDARGTFLKLKQGSLLIFLGEMTCLEEEQGQSDDLNSKDGVCPNEGRSDEKAPTEENKIKAAEADEIKSFKCKEKEQRDDEASTVESERVYEEVTETSLWLDVKPGLDKTDPTKASVLEQVSALGDDIFGDDPLVGCSKRGGWRMHLAVGQVAEKTTLLGFIVWRIKPERNMLIVSQLAVPEQFRRHGFGKMLVELLIAEAKRLPQVYTVSLSSLPGSVKFYKRLGFKQDTFSSAKAAFLRYFDPDPAGADDYKMYTRHMGVVEGVKTTFSDSELADFGLLEGSEVDARQVLLYHSAEECLGQAGLGRKDTQGQSIGFFCGLSGNDRYFEWMSGSLKTSKIAASLMSSGGVVNRIAWFYGSKGPSMAVDTEESSGAAALDTAVAYLREDRCARAIVSGVNWIQLPVSLILCCATGMLSASGRGRAFDESADGNVRSEGVVSVLMEAHGRWRRAAEAEVDEFRPAAEEWDAELQDDMQKHRLLICGSALNSRGQSSSLLAPSSAAIQDLIESALKDAKCPASIVDGVEANAGGNSLSDAVELNILRRCLAAEDAAKTTTSSASVRATKTLIGEPGPPGGLACLARACFTLQKAVSGPLIHLRQLSEIAAQQADEDETLAPKLLLTTEATASL
ncbi:ppsC [Symbiodinium sp. CCMP2592]|nr:ppsC [Symbiodinium sp. CCMP2592]